MRQLQRAASAFPEHGRRCGSKLTLTASVCLLSLARVPSYYWLGKGRSAFMMTTRATVERWLRAHQKDASARELLADLGADADRQRAQLGVVSELVGVEVPHW